MTTGVLMYCFDTPTMEYSKLALKSCELIKKNLNLPITIVTDHDTHRKFPQFGGLTYRIIKPQTQNYRFYRGKNVPWYNMERAKAYEHSLYDTTLLLDCDYLCFTSNLLELCKTNNDFLIHNKVNDITGLNRIVGRLESTIPIVWATVVMFQKNEKVKKIFDMIKHVQENYEHFRNLYRIKFLNYRNDYAFAIALHQLKGQIIDQDFIPTAMNMLPHEFDVLDIDEKSLVYQYNKKVNVITDMDVHVLDKEFINVG
tara:strand:- start:2433 stop:3200 length:768 start_codon:yes stop_codon:yes gene_type:complete